MSCNIREDGTFYSQLKAHIFYQDDLVKPRPPYASRGPWFTMVSCIQRQPHPLCTLVAGNVGINGLTISIQMATCAMNVSAGNPVNAWARNARVSDRVAFWAIFYV